METPQGPKRLASVLRGKQRRTEEELPPKLLPLHLRCAWAFFLKAIFLFPPSCLLFLFLFTSLQYFRQQETASFAIGASPIWRQHYLSGVGCLRCRALPISVWGVDSRCLERWSRKGVSMQKNDAHLAVPLTGLQLPLLPPERQSLAVQELEIWSYDLRSFIVHMGGLHCGHYVAYVRSEETWYEINDAMVREIHSQEAARRAGDAYLLVYELVSYQGFVALESLTSVQTSSLDAGSKVKEKKSANFMDRVCGFNALAKWSTCCSKSSGCSEMTSLHKHRQFPLREDGCTE